VIGLQRLALVPAGAIGPVRLSTERPFQSLIAVLTEVVHTLVICLLTLSARVPVLAQ
jgi:hypothetical protein